MQKLGQPPPPPAVAEPELEDEEEPDEDELDEEEPDEEEPQAHRRAVVAQLRLVAADARISNAELDRRIANVGW